MKSILVCSIVAACTLVGNAQASVVWTVSASGTVIRGSNEFQSIPIAGLGPDLTGMSFTQTITVSSDPNDYWGVYKSADSSLLQGNIPGGSDTITLNGHSFTIPLGLGYGSQEIDMGATNHSASDPNDTVYTQYSGGSNPMFASIYASSTDFGFVPSLDFQQQLYISNTSALQSYSSIRWLSSGGVLLAQIFGTVDTLVVNNATPSTSVPEPASILLFGSGCAALVALRRRQRVDGSNDAV